MTPDPDLPARRDADPEEGRSAEPARSIWLRALKIAVLVLGLAAGIVALASAWLGGETLDRPFDYERFE